MAFPSVTRATAELDYPLYALDFDPEDANCLIVGGGGGAGRHGIPNKITVLTTPSHDELRIAGEMTLPSEEDSVMSLAVGRAQRQKAVRFYAGVNSSQADLAKGINQHLRTLVLEHPPKTRSSSSASNSPLSASSKGPRALVKMTELSRTALFTNPDPDNYLRRLRIAGPVGVTASELGKDPQIAVFDAVGAKPKPRGVLELPRHASDLDIIQTGEDRFQLAFCYDDQVHVVNIAEHSGEPELVFSMPEDHGQRPVLRLIRYLTPEFILAASNLPQKGGLLIQALRLPSASHGKARVATAVRIPRKALATALAVANLSPPWPAWSPAGSTQFVIALGASDSSTCLYTLEHRPSTAINLLFDLHHACTLTGKLSVTSLSFSTLTPSKTHTRPHSIKLASIYMGGLVAVDNVPLKKHIDQAPRKSKGPPGPTRHVVAIRSRGPSSRPLIIALTLIVLVMALVGRAVMEMYGRNEPVVLANRFFHSWHGTLASPELRPSVPMVPDFITKLEGGKRTFSPGQTVVIFEAPPDQKSRTSIQVGVHDAHVHEPAKTWDELSVEQRLLWRCRLRDAGAWTQAMGEGVFKGILFGQIAGAIGRAMDT